HRGDAPRRGPLERVDHHQQFHQVLIHRVAAGLDDEYVCPAHVFQNLKINLAVAEASQRALPQRHVEVARDLLRQRAVGHPRKQLELLVDQEFPLRTLENALWGRPAPEDSGLRRHLYPRAGDATLPLNARRYSSLETVSEMKTRSSGNCIAARRACAGDWKTPNTAEPLPASATPAAPWRSRARLIRASRGCRRNTGASKSFSRMFPRPLHERAQKLVILRVDPGVVNADARSQP